MGLKEIEEGIRESVEKEIERVRSGAEKEAERIREENRKAAKKRHDEIVERGRKSCIITKKRVTGNAKLEAREMIEKTRNRILDDAFRKARESILRAGDKEKKLMLERFVKEGVKGIDKPEVYVDPKYVNLLKGARKKALDDFGVLITDSKGGVSVDYTLENRLAMMRDKMEHEVARILWPK